MIQIDMQMPERCGVCFAMHTDEIGLESWCGIDETARDLYTADINTKRPEWCPLKEQEAVEPIITPWAYDEDGNIVLAKKECGKCGYQFFTERPNFCENCGTPILWEK